MPLATEVGLGPGDIVLDGNPASPHGRGHDSLPRVFRPMSIVAKRSPISATAELLYILTFYYFAPSRGGAKRIGMSVWLSVCSHIAITMSELHEMFCTSYL